MLATWLTSDKIQLVEHIDSWQEAIKKAAEPLIADNSIQAGYIEEIFAQHQQLGPYYILAPHIAMPHARPNGFVSRSCISLLIISNGVNFGSVDKDPVQLLILLAAEDNTKHIGLLSELMKLLSSDDDIKMMLNSKSKDQIIEIVNKF